MEKELIAIGIIALVGAYLFVQKTYTNLSHLNRELKHQRAIVSVLRHRLGDKQDNSKSFDREELEKLWDWADRELKKINIQDIEKTTHKHKIR